MGIGRTGYSRASGRTPTALAAEAVRNALEDCGLTPADVDGMTCYGGNVSPNQIAYAIGLDSLSWITDTVGGGNVVSAVVANAAAAIVTGQCEVAVVYRVLGSETRYGANTSAVQVGGRPAVVRAARFHRAAPVVRHGGSAAHGASTGRPTRISEPSPYRRGRTPRRTRTPSPATRSIWTTI